jgi:hypothetical protein
MVSKPSFAVGILPDGSPEVILASDAQSCLDAYRTHKDSTSSKYTQLMVYRMPRYWKRHDTAKASANMPELEPEIITETQAEPDKDQTQKRKR